MKLRVLLLCITCSFLFIDSSDVYACSCMYPGTPAEEIERSDVVFVGWAGNDKMYPYFGDSNNLEDVFMRSIVRTTFTVDQWIKGPIDKKKIIIETSDSGSSCGIEFMTGLKYVVYGFYSEDNKDIIVVSLCSRTGPVFIDPEDIPYTKTQEDLDYFATIKQSYKTHDMQTSYAVEPETPVSIYRYIITICVVVVILGGSYIIYKRKR